MTTQPALYRLKFMPEALDEWSKLDGSIKTLLKKQLKKRLESPHSPGNERRGDLKNCYKIKLRKQGYRLVYQVEDNVLTVLVLAVARREDLEAYKNAVQRLLDKS
jgi:mRNA interferase RelE/StbE